MNKSVKRLYKINRRKNIDRDIAGHFISETLNSLENEELAPMNTADVFCGNSGERISAIKVSN